MSFISGFVGPCRIPHESQNHLVEPATVVVAGLQDRVTMINHRRYTLRQIARWVVVPLFLVAFLFVLALPILPFERFPTWLKVVSIVLGVVYVVGEIYTWIRRPR